MPRVLTRPRPENPFVTGGIRPYGRAQAARRRVAHLAADGYTAGEIAEIEDVRAEHVEQLLGDERFGKIVRAYKVLETKPPEERRERLVRMAWWLIEEALALGHVRVGFYVIRERLRARDAAEMVVDKLLRQRAEAAEPSPAAPPLAEAPADAEPSSSPSPAKPHLPAHPADRMAQRAQSQLMRALLGENRVREEGKARATRQALAAAKAARHARGLPPHLLERHDRLIERLRDLRARPEVPPPPEGCPPKRSRAP